MLLCTRPGRIRACSKLVRHHWTPCGSVIVLGPGFRDPEGVPGNAQAFEVGPDDSSPPGPELTAAELHQEAFEGALQRVTGEARADFERRGKRWECAPDRCGGSPLHDTAQGPPLPFEFNGLRWG